MKVGGQPGLRSESSSPRKKEKKRNQRKGGRGGRVETASAAGRGGQGDPALAEQQLFRQTWKGSGQKGEEEQEGTHQNYLIK